ncbi:MAG TPA: hypothetical protein PK879_12155 [Opitutaceae bacterium]|nr:hypothetical protein [Opitutaceae bacterium]OQB91756.1 MAG: hypothetical protein BWX86_01948 [Verrucomicrobia bacterium ADurb.Bin122]HOF08388.1 hypothetical protein [Opitutaceae bacterium]HOG92006.1 hypothetical protein [Opitutaceae bacterium]HOY55721.1 hypothetical protein [Opitutaceae bacterium]
MLGIEAEKEGADHLFVQKTHGRDRGARIGKSKADHINANRLPVALSRLTKNAQFVLVF